MKVCANCTNKIDNRKKFCSDNCRYWFNVIKKEREAHLPPVKKRNNRFFSMVTGYGVAKMKGAERQGRRSGHMVTGAMGARVNCTNEEWAEINYDNLKRHFTSISFYRPWGIKLGDGTEIKEKEIQKKLNIKIDF